MVAFVSYFCLTWIESQWKLEKWDEAHGKHICKGQYEGLALQLLYYFRKFCYQIANNPVDRASEYKLVTLKIFKIKNYNHIIWLKSDSSEILKKIKRDLSFFFCIVIVEYNSLVFVLT